MKKIIILNLLFLVSANLVVAQTLLGGGSGFSDTKNIVVTNGLWITNKKTKKAIKGTPYLFNDWKNNSQVYIKDKAYKIPLFNYNVRSERFEAKFSKDSILIINPRNVTKVIINNKTFKRYLDPEYQRNSYFEEMSTIDDVSLIKKYIVSVKEGDLNPMTQQQISPDEYVKREVFYIKDENNNLKKIRLKKSVVLSLIKPEKRNAIKEYSKKNRLKLNRSNDVIKLLSYYKTI